MDSPDSDGWDSLELRAGSEGVLLLSGNLEPLGDILRCDAAEENAKKLSWRTKGGKVNRKCCCDSGTILVLI